MQMFYIVLVVNFVGDNKELIQYNNSDETLTELYLATVSLTVI